MRLPYGLAAPDGCWAADYDSRTVRQCVPGGSGPRGKDLLFIAGGIGLAPLRSVINYVLHYRENYGKIDIVYGSRSKEDLVDFDEINNEWSNAKMWNVYLTIDREQEGWDGHVGFVAYYVKELDLLRIKRRSYAAAAS